MREIEITNVYERNAASLARILANQGGARSTKSWSIAQLLIRRFWNETKKKILVSRKTGPALHLTAYRLVTDLLKDYGFYKYCHHDKTYSEILNPFNGSRFNFLPVDDPEKIKSTEWNYAWLEEANEFTWEDFLIFQTRMSGPTIPAEPNQIILSYNPSDEQGWIQQKLILSPAFKGKVDLIRSTYKDNPFLSDEYIEVLEGLKDQDHTAYQVFALGEYGDIPSIIYAPYEVLPAFPDNFDETYYGMDFGFNNPSGILEVNVKDVRNFYLRQLLYRTHLTNGQLIEQALDLIPPDRRSLPLYADCAEPDRIEEFCRAGFNCIPADKEVKIGIDFCKRQKFYTLAENVDLNKERGAYRWRQDKNGNVLDEPVKFMDHLMDSKRYAIWTHNKDRMNMPGYS